MTGATALRQPAIFVTALKTGLSICCILALQIDDIWDGKAMRSRIRIRRRTTKGKHSGYDMPLHPHAICSSPHLTARLISTRVKVLKEKDRVQKHA